MAHERYERTMNLNRKRFKRRTGMYPETFEAMQAVVVERERIKKKTGRPAALSPSEQPLLTLKFRREYRSYAHLGDDWGVHETTVQRTVERVEVALLSSGRCSLPGRSALATETALIADAGCQGWGMIMVIRSLRIQPPTAVRSRWSSGVRIACWRTSGSGSSMWFDGRSSGG